MTPSAQPLLLGVEIGGTKLQLGLGRGDGTILALERRSIRPEYGARGILEQIEQAYPVLLANPSTHGETPVAAGIGFGGPVDADRGRVALSHQVEGWDGFELAAWATRMLGIPRVAIANDADTAGLGEARHGAGVGRSPVFYVTIGSGIGGGLIIDGRIYRGSGRGAAEVGHLWVEDPPFGPSKLEDVASGWSIGRIARGSLADGEKGSFLDTFANGTHSKRDASVVARAAAEGDALALRIVARAATAVGHALGHVVTLLSPERIILGGGVSMIAERLWIEPIRRTIESRAFPPFAGTYDVVTAELGEAVVVQGALAIASDLVRSKT